MSAAAPSSPASISRELPANAYYHLIHSLRRALPPPLTDSPEDLTCRDHSVIARIAALCPANAVEADIAGLYVAASEQCKECLRLAQQADKKNPIWAMQCRAQANAMMRQVQAALSLLLRLQAARDKREADKVTCDRAAWTEHCAIGFMAEALSPRAAPAPNPEPPPPKPQPQPEPAHRPAARQDAAIDPQTAAPVQGTAPGLGDGISFDPADEELLRSIIAAFTPPFAPPDP